MSNISKIVFIHGWALNSRVWVSFEAYLREVRPQLNLQFIDLPGYGPFTADTSPSDLRSLADHCLDVTQNEPSLWVGWSLGGMVAMQAAIQSRDSRIKGMQIVNSSPKFVASEDWPDGVDLQLFAKFSKELAADYERTLMMFLLMQSGANTGSREVARSAHDAISQSPNPSAETLNAGIECLAQSDLRSKLPEIDIPVQIVSGLRDRVAKPESASRLAMMLSAELVTLNTGHAPFMTEPELMRDHLFRLLDRLNVCEGDCESKEDEDEPR